MIRTTAAAVAILVLSVLPSQARAVKASYYSAPQKTASGERFNPSALTAAHRSLPFGTRVRVSYHGKSVVVRIDDRGPYVRGREIDLSLAAARVIGLTGAGVGVVNMQVL